MDEVVHYQVVIEGNTTYDALRQFVEDVRMGGEVAGEPGHWVTADSITVVLPKAPPK
jgi:hypothetical protein